MRFLVSGVGAVGTRLARQLVSTEGVEQVVLRDERNDRVAQVASSLGPRSVADTAPYLAPIDVDVVVLAGDAGTHGEAARRFLGEGRPVVSVSDALEDIRAILALDPEARERGLPLVVGAGFSPGLSCILARHAASRFDVVEELHVAKVGTGGPACARQHHRALGRAAWDWRDGWVRRPAGSGRELCWFPDPIGGRDCYRAELAEPVLLQRALPELRRVTARVAATRRDRLTLALPMLWPTHPEGGPGAIRVEARGRRAKASDVVVLGAMDRPAVAAGAVAALAALRVARGEVAVGVRGLAEVDTSVTLLTELRDRGVRAAGFRNAGASAGPLAS